jgi:hypothetical protein
MKKVYTESSGNHIPMDRSRQKRSIRNLRERLVLGKPTARTRSQKVPFVSMVSYTPLRVSLPESSIPQGGTPQLRPGHVHSDMGKCQWR